MTHTRFHQDRWHNHFFHLAHQASLMSKDPSTQVGAILVKDRRVVGTGFNGFPRGISDNHRLDDRESKYPRIIHAEMNALLDAGREAQGATLYLWGFGSLPCSNCTKHLIQAEIDGVLSYGPAAPTRWWDDLDISEEMMKEAHIPFAIVPYHVACRS